MFSIKLLLFLFWATWSHAQGLLPVLKPGITHDCSGDHLVPRITVQGKHFPGFAPLCPVSCVFY